MRNELVKGWRVVFCVSALASQTLFLSQTVAINNQLKAIDATAGDKNFDRPLVESVLPRYLDRQNGLSISDLVDRAINANGELSIARLEIDKAKARLQQARLRQNPTVEVEQTSGRILGSPNEGEFNVGASMPLDLFGQRQARVRLAELEILAKEAEVRERERQLTNEILSNFIGALSSMHEIETMERLLELDTETARIVQIRVNEGDTPPLELNQLQVEIERLRSKRQLAGGRLDSSIAKLKLVTGFQAGEPLRLRETFTDAVFPPVLDTLPNLIEQATRSRSDMKLALSEMELAKAGIKLASVEGKPEVSATTRYTRATSSFDDTFEGTLINRDNTLTFGVSVSLPIFDRKQGAKAEAEIEVRSATAKKDLVETTIRSEVTAAYQRIQAAEQAVNTLLTGAIPRAEQNVKTFRAEYGIGEIKMTDLVGEQRRLQEINQDLTEALAERFRAKAELIIAAGLSIKPGK